MQALIDTVANIQKTIKIHGPALSKNETMTRYALIDPLLVQLGWDLSDPGDVVPEDNTSPGGKTDYTLGSGAMIVEAKKLDENLDKYVDKLISYVRSRNVRYGVLTNGRKWRMYDANATTKSTEIEFDVTDSDWMVLSKSIHLHKIVVLGSIPRPTLTRTETREMILEALHPETMPPVRTIPEIVLEDITYKKGDSPPNTLIHRDGSRKALGSWVDLLAGVAEWLVNNGHLTTRHCPIRIGSKNYLLHTKPTHPNGKSFSTHRQVGGLCLYTNFSPSDVIRHAKSLIRKAGMEPSDFKVDQQDSSRRDE